MHILIGALTAVVTLIFLINRFVSGARQAREIGDEIGKTAESLANLPRRMGFRRRAGQTGLRGVEDPREAAAILVRLMTFSRKGEPASPAERSVMEKRLGSLFGMTPVEARELMDYVDWIIRDVEIPSGPMSNMSKILRNAPGMGRADMADIDDILVEVSRINGPATDRQIRLLEIFLERAGLMT